MISSVTRLSAVAVAAALAACAATAPMPSGKPEFMLVGVDTKVVFADDGSLQFLAPGKDSIVIVDIGTDPAKPRIVTSLPLMNSVVGPPTNLAITPDGALAIVANSLEWVPDGANWKFVPDNKLYVIDLTRSPPALIDTVAIGKQPSGLSINRAGDLALVANRADSSISVLSIRGKQVKLVDTVAMGEMVAAVVFTPDGKRALAGKFPGHKVAFLDVDGQKVTYNKRDVSVGLWPYNLAVSADGKLALTGDNGNAGALGRQCRHGHGRRHRGEPAAGSRQGRRGRSTRSFRGQPRRAHCRSHPAGRLGWPEEQLVLRSQRQRARSSSSTARRCRRSARSWWTASPKARCSVPTASG